MASLSEPGSHPVRATDTIPIVEVLRELIDLEKHLASWVVRVRGGPYVSLAIVRHSVAATRRSLSGVAGSADAAHRETAGASPSGDAYGYSAQPVAPEPNSPCPRCAITAAKLEGCRNDFRRILDRIDAIAAECRELNGRLVDREETG